MEEFGTRVALGYGVLLGGVWLVAVGLEQNGADNSSNGIWNLVSTLRWILSAPIPIALVAWLIARPRKERPAPTRDIAVPLVLPTPIASAVMPETPAPTSETSVDEAPSEKDQVQSEPIPPEGLVMRVKPRHQHLRSCYEHSANGSRPKTFYTSS